MPKVCRNCGSILEKEFSFCPKCGYPADAEMQAPKPTRAQRKAAKLIRKQHAKEEANRGKDLSERIRQEQKAHAQKLSSQRQARRKAKTIQDALGFENIYEDGIALVEDGLYAQTIALPDVNFQAARPDEQDRIWNLLGAFYNSFTPDVTIQLTILNRVSDAENRFEEIKLPYTGNHMEDQLVDDYNEMLKEQIAKVGQKEVVRGIYFTFSVAAADHASATVQLATIVRSALDQMSAIGSEGHPLNATEYMQLVGDLIRPEDGVTYDYGQTLAADIDIKDAVSPSMADFTPDGATGKNNVYCLGAKYELADEIASDRVWYQCLQFKDPFPAMADPNAIASIIRLPYSMCLTIYVHPTGQASTINYVQKKLSFMKTQEAHEGKAAAREGLDPVISRSITLTQNLAEATDTLDALLNRNERMFTCTIFVTTWHRDRTTLNEHAFRIAQEASSRLFVLHVPQFQNRDAMNSMLPFGNDYMAWNRKLLTTEISTFMPFVTQEISDKGGVFYGNNELSGNMILLNRKRLAAPMGWIMGKPGSGKSFAAKQEIFDTVIAHPDDEIMIIDPKAEYTLLTERLNGQVIDLAADSQAHLNPFDLSDAYSPDSPDPLIFKSSFVTSLIATLVGERSLTPKMLSIIDKTVSASYEYMRRTDPGTMPTLTIFWQLLGRLDDPDAHELYQALEMYVTGSLKTFAYTSNVNINARIVDFNMQRLQYNLRLFGQLVAVDAVWNRVAKNHQEGKRTWIYIDEAQNFFNSQSTIEYFTKYWAEGRSYGLIPTGITQNADRIIHHPEAKHMFSNSEFIELLSQAPNDLNDIQNMFNLSDEQASHITNSLPGQGLLIAGDAVVPFRNEFPKDTALYELMDTDPNAAEEKRREERNRRRMERGRQEQQ